MAGEIPQELGNLTKMETLILNGGKLTVPGSLNLSGLINLKTLAVTANGPSWEIPPSIGRLKNLKISL